VTTGESLLAFSLASAVLFLTPGMDTALILRTSAVKGARPATFVALGITVGCLVWGIAVSLGLGGLLAASELAYNVLKIAGAGYLVWLGLGLLFKPRQAAAMIVETEPEVGQGNFSWFMKGLFSDLLNPKVGVFFMTFLPQFVPNGVSVSGWSMLLTVINVTMGLAYCALLVAASARIGRFLRTPKVVRALDRVTGCVFIAFGAKLALSRRA
jgi:threonine/homoserine/homoserine lactone efflux protein